MNIKRKIAIIGAGGHGKVVGEIALLKKYKVIHFFDENINETEKYPFKIMGNLELLKKNKDNYDCFFVSIGNNKTRQKKMEWLKKNKMSITSLIHPKSIISKLSFIGIGSCVMANAVVNPGAIIKNGVIINTSASIDHDCVINDYAHISPNCSLSGSVKIGKLTHLGTGTSVHPETKIGNNVKTAIGSKVFKNIPNDIIYKI